MGTSALLSLLIAAALVAYPFSRILPRYGINPWISLVSVFPPGALLLLWIIAFREPETTQ